MNPENVQLLAIRDNAPVYRDIVGEDAEFHEAAELANHLQALHHRIGMACRFNIDVTAVAPGHFFDNFDHVIV